REYNRQRVKSRDEILREQVTDVNPDTEYRALTAYRKRKAKIKSQPIEIEQSRVRCEITEAKMPFLGAIQRVITDLEEFLPLTVRQIHYQLLNDPPLVHAS